jgi:hypothetical protein
MCFAMHGRQFSFLREPRLPVQVSALNEGGPFWLTSIQSVYLIKYDYNKNY